MNREPDSPQTSPEPTGETIEPLTLIPVEVVLSILSDLKAEDTTVIQTIEDVLGEPVPDPNDEAAMADYRRKMRAIRNASQHVEGSSSRLADFHERLKERMAEIGELMGEDEAPID